MKSSLDHLPEKKQRELARVVEIIHEEFENALKGGEAEFKKKGRILKIILFGSYARGTWVDEPHTMKGYRSDYDILIIVNTKKLTDAEYWYAAKDRLMRDRGIKTLVNPIIHSRREVGDALHQGRYFFSDIRREGIALFEADDKELPAAKVLSRELVYEAAKLYYEHRLCDARVFLKTSKFCLAEGNFRQAAFLLHQALEQAYSGLLLVFSNYSPSSHSLALLRNLAEERRQDLAEVWPRDRHRFVAWFNTLNEAYVKARYSPHYTISEEALSWLVGRSEELIDAVDAACADHITQLSGAN
ncbi:HEPN domain-containing protein [Rhizobium sp. SEMIA 4085]|uniref:Nucleotidyltransferase domain-containing protein n=1 Tax=Rhizobium gallicum bv. gallicum R602sp TaxID=1041138 RepID=A0A0B4XBL8_9HYPH|nr:MULTISPECIES: nucleotidyltransferase and HEPN domain-containing protein [Rhizobium]AJD44175.1 nucleotidyltransferase domain-containing protein [Rhizobium gallicum bv. gallicum R602sp]NNH32811.1 HEPN domain-containing protein [Rhizobium sp. SEMIA 4085]